MKKAIIAFISLIIFCIEPLMASAEFSFKKYQVENGLSHNTTWCAIQTIFSFYDFLDFATNEYSIFSCLIKIQEMIVRAIINV